MFCTNCGNQVPDSAKFCTNCGHTLNTAQVRDEATVAAPVVSQDTPVQQVQYNQPGQIQEPYGQQTFGNQYYGQHSAYTGPDYDSPNLIDNFKMVMTKKFAQFEGRANRGEYWKFLLVAMILPCIFYILILIGLASETEGMIYFFGFLDFLTYIAVIIPSITCLVRRLHDINKSGWNYWWQLIPFGSFYLLYLLFQPSDPGPNMYGKPENYAPYKSH